MAQSDYAGLANAIMTNYGQVLANAFSQTGLDQDGLIHPLSMFGRVRDWGGVEIGPQDLQENNAFDWGIDDAAETGAVSYGASDSYTADTAENFVSMSLAWKRVGIPMSWDDLLAVTRTPLRNGANALDRRMTLKVQAILAKIETMMATDGTGNSSKDLTGFLAFLSATNTYAGQAQTGNTFWQASLVTAGTALAKSHFEDAVGALWDKKVLKPGSHEIWMSRQVWYDYVALYNPKVQTGPMDAGGDRVGMSYSDGNVEIPIYVLPSMTSGEIWILDKAQTKLRFSDQTPTHGLPVEANEELMVQGVPLGIKYVPESKDTTSIWLRAYPQLGCLLPRNNAAIISITV